MNQAEAWRRRDAETPGPEEGRVLVWHRYNGVMVYPWDMPHGKLITHWKRVPEETDRIWRRTGRGRPNRRDGGAEGNVIARHKNGAVDLRRWDYATAENGYTAWMTIPEGPGEEG